MKSKEQKRAEAIERGKRSFAAKHAHGTRSRFSSEEEYLDLFRAKRARVGSGPGHRRVSKGCGFCGGPSFASRSCPGCGASCPPIIQGRAIDLRPIADVADVDTLIRACFEDEGVTHVKLTPRQVHRLACLKDGFGNFLYRIDPGPGEGGFMRTFCGLAVVAERAE